MLTGHNLNKYLLLFQMICVHYLIIIGSFICYSLAMNQLNNLDKYNYTVVIGPYIGHNYVTYRL